MEPPRRVLNHQATNSLSLSLNEFLSILHKVKELQQEVLRETPQKIPLQLVSKPRLKGKDLLDAAQGNQNQNRG